MVRSSDIKLSEILEWTRLSVLAVFKTTFAMTAVQMATKPPEQPGGLVVSEIGFKGTLSVRNRLCIDSAGAERLSSIALRMPTAEICNTHVDDLVGEISNMVLGAVKSRVSNLGIPCSMTIPTVTRRECVFPAPPGESDLGTLYFLFEKHCLSFEVFMPQKAEGDEPVV